MKCEFESMRMYYEHQYDRIAKLEEQSLTITNVVVSLSVVAMTFGFDSTHKSSAISSFGLPTIIVFANAFAVMYIIRVGSWIRTHQLRTKLILKECEPDIYGFDRETHAPFKTGLWKPSRRKIQIILHCLLIITSAMLPLLL